jgi:hypothetical protein
MTDNQKIESAMVAFIERVLCGEPGTTEGERAILPQIIEQYYYGKIKLVKSKPFEYCTTSEVELMRAVVEDYDNYRNALENRQCSSDSLQGESNCTA